MSPALRVEYCGEWSTVDADARFTIGREGDLSVDDNPYLHRSFLELRCEQGVWLLANVGKQLSATIGDEQGQLVAHLAPGGGRAAGGRPHLRALRCRAHHLRGAAGAARPSLPTARA